MSVFKKLSQARSKLHKMSLKKSGLNKFSGYSYFELGDFLPATIEIFNELGLCAVVSYASDIATLTLINAEDPSEKFEIKSPMGSANLKGCHEIQNIGAAQTYQRRYLWTTLMELCENDVLDATTNVNTKQEFQSKDQILKDLKGKIRTILVQKTAGMEPEAKALYYTEVFGSADINFIRDERDIVILNGFLTKLGGI